MTEENKKQNPYMETHVKVILAVLIVMAFAMFAFNQWFLSSL